MRAAGFGAAPGATRLRREAWPIASDGQGKLNAMLKIEFDGNGADEDVGAVIEQQLRKAVESLRCQQHFPGRVSFYVDRAHVRVVDGCCDSFLQTVREAIVEALAF